MSAETEHNVVVRLSVVRPEDEYLPELLRRRLNGWDAYTGHIRVRGVDVLWGHSPFPEGTAAEALATLDASAPSDADSGWIAVTPETMPKEGQNVLVCYLSRYNGKPHVIRAMWATSEMQDSWDWEDWEPDDGDRRDGWFETADNADECWRISETVTHWCPLPSPPVQP